jgi:hypothetical protein
VLSIIGLLLVTVAIVSVVWGLIKRFKPGVEHTTIGSGVEKGVDKAQDWTFLGVFKAARWTDEVSDDLQAIWCVDYLYAKFADKPLPQPLVANIPAAPLASASNADVHYGPVQSTKAVSPATNGDDGVFHLDIE